MESNDAKSAKGGTQPTMETRQRKVSPRFPFRTAAGLADQRQRDRRDAVVIRRSADRCEAMRAAERMDCAHRESCIVVAAKRNWPCLPCRRCDRYVAVERLSRKGRNPSNGIESR